MGQASGRLARVVLAWVVNMAKRKSGQLERERRKLRQLTIKMDRHGARFGAMLAESQPTGSQALARKAAALRQLATDLCRQCQKVNRLQPAKGTGKPA